MTLLTVWLSWLVSGEPCDLWPLWLKIPGWLVTIVTWVYSWLVTDFYCENFYLWLFTDLSLLSDFAAVLILLSLSRSNTAINFSASFNRGLLTDQKLILWSAVYHHHPSVWHTIWCPFTMRAVKKKVVNWKLQGRTSSSIVWTVRFYSCWSSQQAVGKLRVKCDLLDFSPCHEVGGDDKIKALV